jgi:hypothetical protein
LQRAVALAVPFESGPRAVGSMPVELNDHPLLMPNAVGLYPFTA